MLKQVLGWMGILIFGATQVLAINNCLTFDGVDDWVNTPTSAGIPTSGNFTVECWAKCPSNPGTYKEILSQGSSGNAFYIGTDVDGNIRLGDGWTSTGIPFPFGGWHHFAVVKTSSDTLFYMDGLFQTNLSSAILNPAFDAPFRLGRQYGGYGEYWSGSIDDVRIWEGVRTAAEIKNNRSLLSNETGASSSLRVRYLFDQTEGVVLEDTQGIGSGTLENMSGSEWTSVVAVDIATQDILVTTQTVSLSGTNTASAVTVTWTNGTTGASGIATVSGMTFEISDIPLTAGTNHISVIGSTADGMMDVDSALIIREPVTYYVSPAGNASWPYTNWTMAATSIQDAVDAARTGDIVLVTNGTYNTGGVVAPGQGSTNRVCLTQAITLRSVNGPEVTVIEGKQSTASHSWTNTVRGVYLAEGALISGFTVTNGYTSGENYSDSSNGGGLFMQSGAWATNCVLSGNKGDLGGGAYGGTLVDCILSKNDAPYGGGAYESTLIRCILTQNTFAYRGGGAHKSTLTDCVLNENSGRTYSYGGGAAQSTLTGCTIVNNSVKKDGGGVYEATLQNCIVWDNIAASNDNNIGKSTVSYCCISDGATDGVDGCITNNPDFMSAVNGDYRLSMVSPCIDAGINGVVTTDIDLAGHARIINGTVDIGAYEALETYTITTIAGAYGSITPTDPILFSGDDQTLTITPNNGYGLFSLTVDGIEVPATNSFTFTNVQTNHTLEAVFDIPYTLTVNNGLGSGIFYAGETPLVIADEAEEGFVFHTWSTEPEWAVTNFLDRYINFFSPFNMPATNVVLTPEYRSLICYVDAAQTNDEGNGLGWDSAKMTIQAAIDSVAVSGTVWVADGVYSSGGSLVDGHVCSNRIYIANGITVRSMNGPENTIIQGESGMRCAYLESGTLTGFTLTQGQALSSAPIWTIDSAGGGVFLASGVVTHCTLTGNQAGYGGGAALGIDPMFFGPRSSYPEMTHCTLSGNMATYGGGADLGENGMIARCLLINNTAVIGGGGVSLWGGIVSQSTLSGNFATSFGGGAYKHETALSFDVVDNCIVWGNHAPLPGNDLYNLNVYYSCYGNSSIPTQRGCIVADPCFTDSAAGDYTLYANSPCIDTGENSPVIIITDLAGNAISGGVDMGAYEYVLVGTDTDGDGIPDSWEKRYFSSVLDCVTNAYTDSDSFNNWQEYIAGTDPTDGTSYFQMTNSGSVGEGFLIEWNAVSNRTYSIEHAASLTNEFEMLQSGLDYPQSSYTDTNVVARTNGFYRVQVDLQ